MTREQFEAQLRQFKRQEPFQPFVVELLDGRQIVIDGQGFVFNGGAATYMTPGMDLVMFDCDEVRDIRPVDRSAKGGCQMTQEQFEAQLRHFLHREPFQPFVVELLDGRVIVIDSTRLGFGGGSAGFVTATEDLVMFEYPEVREIRDASHEMSS